MVFQHIGLQVAQTNRGILFPALLIQSILLRQVYVYHTVAVRMKQGQSFLTGSLMRRRVSIFDDNHVVKYAQIVRT
jgi:hypothetical protein